MRRIRTRRFVNPGRLKLIATAFSFAGYAAVSPESAIAQFTGATLSGYYYYPDLSTLYNGPIAVTQNAGVEFNHNLDPIFSLDVGANSITANAFTSNNNWTSSVFNGFRLQDSGANDVPAITGVAVDASTNMSGLSASRITFDADNVYLNWQGLSFNTSTLVRLNVAFGAVSWNNNLGGSWHQDANWNPAVSPNAATDANFTLASTYTVSLNANAAAKSVAVNLGDVTFDLNGNSLAASSLRVSRPGGHTSLRLTDGTVNISGTTSQNVGFGAEKGTLYVDGATLNMLSASRLTVGDAEYGQLDVINGGKVNVGGNLFGGDSNNASASILVSGPGSEVNVGGLVLSNQVNDATALTVSNGGKLNVTSTAELTNGDSTSISQVVVTGSNSQFNATTLSLGGTGATNSGGVGNLTISSGGVVTVTGTTYVLNSNTRDLNNNLGIDSNERTQINLTGGTLKTGTLDLGSSPTRLNWDSGTLELTASGLDVGTGYTLGNSISLPGGVNAKSLIASGNIFIGRGSAGTLSVTGGLLESKSPAGGLSIGIVAGGTGAATISSGTIRTTYDFDIGSGVGGSFTQSGGFVSIGHAFNVANGGGTGTALLSGGSLSTTGIVVGAGGSSGTLSISGTASVSVAGSTTISSTGGLLVSGGSLTTHGLDMASAASFSFTGGSITIDGGELKPRTGQFFNVSGVGSPVLVFDNGATSTSTTDTWRAGDTSLGTIKILGGSTVNLTSPQLILGNALGSAGTLEVSGAGSQFTSDVSFQVGRGGTGVVTVGNGGSVSAAAVLLGVSSSGAGTVAVETGGSFTTPGAAIFGVSGGTGRLFINGGAVTIYGPVDVRTGTSSINLSAGTLSAGSSFDFNNDGSRFTWTGGTLRLNGDTNPSDGLLTVPNGGTLGGTGNIARPTSVTAGGTIAPGNSPGTMTFSANLTLSTGSELVMEIGAPTPGTGHDQIIMTSGATLAANGAQLKLIAMPGIVTGVPYTIVNATAGAISGTFKYLTTDLFQGGPYAEPDVEFSIDYTSNLVRVTFSAVPEPVSLVPLFAGSLLLRRTRRRVPGSPKRRFV